MMSINRTILLTLVAIGFWHVSAEAERLPVYILAGQSNMVGAGNASELPAALGAPDPNILYHYDVTTLYRYQSLGWMALEANGWTTPKAIGFPGYGQEVGFAHTVADATAGSIAIIKVAQNGTNLTESWHPEATTGDMLYQRMLNEIDLAVSQLDPRWQPDFEALVWVQGSGDAYTFDGRAQAYDENLALLVSGLRDHLQTPDLAVVLNQYHSGSNRPASGVSTLRASQEAFVLSDSYAALVNVDDLQLSGDRIHFRPQAQLPLGQRLGEAYLALIPEPGTAVLMMVGIGLLGRRRKMVKFL